jgi:hypothetical protein
MASWNDIAAAEPDLVAAVDARFDAGLHKTLATLRADGAPRVSGTELQRVGGELWLGSMGGSLKARDLQRDPRFALHSTTTETELGPDGGDAKIAGRAIEVTDPDGQARFVAAFTADGREWPGGDSHLFRLDVDEVVLIRVAGDPPDHMVIDSWREGRGRRRVERR